MKGFLRRILRYLAFEWGQAIGWYKRFCNPSGDEWAAWLKRRGVLHAIGEHCSIQTNVIITDPAYTRLGNNVRLTGCTLFGHDGSVNMLNRAYGLKAPTPSSPPARWSTATCRRAASSPVPLREW